MVRLAHYMTLSQSGSVYHKLTWDMLENVKAFFEELSIKVHQIRTAVTTHFDLGGVCQLTTKRFAMCLFQVCVYLVQLATYMTLDIKFRLEFVCNTQFRIHNIKTMKFSVM